ncbi:MAG: amino acid adenylation domain-containing protein [Acidobacteriia bacterium]|nr:amino acid adenylation domain-containing protein [Terriglobia bacterium]
MKTQEKETKTGQGRIENSYPLSPMQQAMLFNYLDDRHSGVDIEQIVSTLRERVRSDHFQQAWRRVVERHPILRTTFEWEGLADPIQIVHSEAPPAFKEFDWHSLSRAEQEERLISYLESDRHRGFLLNEAPLMRIALFRLGDADYRCVWTFHHALLDGRSFPLVLKEVFTFYEAFCEGREITLDLPRPFGDYIRWLQSKDHSQSEAFWREMLKGFRAPTPFNVPRDSHQDSDTRNHGAQEIRLSKELTETVNSFTQENGLTLNTLIQGAWSLLLHHYSGEEDLVFGATRACRRTALEGAESMVGIFINTLPVRVQVTSDLMLIPFLKGLRTQQVGLREYEHTPLHLVQGWSGVPRGKPLFESIVVFENYLLNTALRAGGGQWLHREFRYIGHTNFPVTVIGYSDAELLLRIEYDRRRFDDSTVERMLGHLKTLLVHMAASPNQKLAEVKMLTHEEYQILVEDWNKGTLDFSKGKCIHQLFEDQVTRSPEKVALICDGERLTYSELNARANRLAHGLREFGVKPDVIVGMYMERSVEMVLGILAILKAGGAYLPIDPAYPQERLNFMLEDSHATVLLTQKELAARVTAPQLRILCVDEFDARPDVDNPQSGTGADNLAYVIYTSGSTGKPKGVGITHYNVARLFQATDPWFHFDSGDVWTLFHSCAFDFSVWEIWGSLLYGGRLVVVPYMVSRSPDAFYELVAKEQVTVLNQTPSAFRQLIQAEEMAEKKKQLALRLVIFGGEALEMQSLKPWFERHGDQRPQLVNMYGITETTVHVTYRPLSSGDVSRGSVIGIPIPDLQIYILDPQRNPVPLGIPGEMHVGGAGLARGYLNRPELTAQRFIVNPFGKDASERLYRTGDLARFLPGHDIEYLGRIDTQVKIRGFRIELGEIESLLCQHPSIREAVVIAREDVPGDKRLVAYVVPHAASPAINELHTHLRRHLPDYMVPSAFVPLKTIPLTNNGKVDRLALPAPDKTQRDLEKPFVAPRTELERTLASLWQSALNVERVGLEDNFFELGGHSLLLVQIHGKLRSLLHRDLPITELFQYPTIRALADHLTEPASTETSTKNIRRRAERQIAARSRRVELEKELDK